MAPPHANVSITGSCSYITGPGDEDDEEEEENHDGATDEGAASVPKYVALFITRDSLIN